MKDNYVCTFFGYCLYQTSIWECLRDPEDGCPSQYTIEELEQQYRMELTGNE